MIVYFEQNDVVDLVRENTTRYYTVTEKIVKEGNCYTKYYLTYTDIRKIKRYIRKMITKRLKFFEDILDNKMEPTLTVTFKDPADEAFFILHTSDGLELDN